MKKKAKENCFRVVFLYSLLLLILLACISYLGKSKNNEIVDLEYKKKIVKKRYAWGLVLPHDATAERLVEGLVQKIDGDGIKKVILLGPNHKKAGRCGITSSFKGWEKDGVGLKANRVIIERLEEQGLLCVDDELVEEEHSFYEVAFMIGRYAANVEVLPFIMRNSLLVDDLDGLVFELENYMDERTLVVASVDFSHYLSDFEAWKHDEVTRKILLEWDYDDLLRLDDSYMDSRSSMYVLMRLMEKKGRKNVEFVEHTNNCEIMGNCDMGATSYFLIRYY